jgi:hypothetical protein
MHPRCLVPITPEIAVFYTNPRSYRVIPDLLTLTLAPEEVTFVNRTVQIYSKEYLFFKEIHPVLDVAFLANLYLEFKYHEHPWIEDLQNAACETFFPNGTEPKSN